jgi:hypothetical protein
MENTIPRSTQLTGTNNYRCCAREPNENNKIKRSKLSCSGFHRSRMVIYAVAYFSRHSSKVIRDFVMQNYHRTMLLGCNGPALKVSPEIF